MCVHLPSPILIQVINKSSNVYTYTGILVYSTEHQVIVYLDNPLYFATLFSFAPSDIRILSKMSTVLSRTKDHRNNLCGTVLGFRGVYYIVKIWTSKDERPYYSFFLEEELMWSNRDFVLKLATE